MNVENMSAGWSQESAGAGESGGKTYSNGGWTERMNYPNWTHRKQRFALKTVTVCRSRRE